jgi:hypothetical protein
MLRYETALRNPTVLPTGEVEAYKAFGEAEDRDGWSNAIFGQFSKLPG